jgi:hypothetical protein
MELDRLLPIYDFRSRYVRRVAADVATVWDVLEGLTTTDLPLTRLLMAARTAGRSLRRGGRGEAVPLPTLARVEGSEIVKGTIAKFWRLRPEPAPIVAGDPEAFVAFSEPGWAKAAMSMRVVAEGGATFVCVETRVRATDAATRRLFSAYWLLIRLGGAGFIRLELLRAVARRSERAAGGRKIQPLG